MTEIYRTIPVTQTQQVKAEPNRDQFGNTRRDNSDRHKDSHAGSKKGDTQRHRSNSSLLFSQSAYEAKLARLQKEGRGDTSRQGSGPGQEKDPEQLIVPALDIPRRIQTLPVVAAVEKSASQFVAQVEAITKHIATKIDAAMRPGPTVPPNPLVVHMGLDFAETGLSGVKVTMGDGLLTVVLSRPAGLESHTTDQIIHSLRQTLQSRFPKRAVKILGEETETPQRTTEPGSDMITLSGMLRRVEDSR